MSKSACSRPNASRRCCSNSPATGWSSVSMPKPVVAMRLLARELPPFVPAATRPVRHASRNRPAVAATARTPARAAGRRGRVSRRRLPAIRARNARGVADDGRPVHRTGAAAASGLAAAAAGAAARGTACASCPVPSAWKAAGGTATMRAATTTCVETAQRPARLGVRAGRRARWLDAARVVRMKLIHAPLEAANDPGDPVACVCRAALPVGFLVPARRFQRRRAVRRAPRSCGYEALAITDECSLAGIVRALEASKITGIKLIVGSEFQLDDGLRLVLLVRDTRPATRSCAG